MGPVLGFEEKINGEEVLRAQVLLQLQFRLYAIPLLEDGVNASSNLGFLFNTKEEEN